jgi:hypothetical protein
MVNLTITIRQMLDLHGHVYSFSTPSFFCEAGTLNYTANKITNSDNYFRPK